MASTAPFPKIMRRPAPSPTPTDVLCGTSTASNAAADAIAAKEKENSPTLLQHKGTFNPSLLEKEEKKDDNGIMIMKPGATAASANDASKLASPSSPCSPETDAPVNSAAASADVDAVKKSSSSPWNPLDEVDSALLSALCDTRERKALFRLEQVIVDFMKDKSSGYMEVGGAFNSIVLNQASGGEASDEQTSAAYQQSLQDLQFQQQRGLRQTSFQRLILHRLADRFNIIREQLNNANERGLVDVGAVNHGQGPMTPGLIRLVKTNESCVPSHLLIDINLVLLINYKNPRARNYGGGNNGINANNAVPVGNNYEEGAVKNITDNMSSATLKSPSVAGSSTSSGKKSNKKMVIMKRNSSSGDAMEGKGKGKQKGKARRKKLEDREKAYEEARARIFGIHERNGGAGGGDDHVEKGEKAAIPQSADAQDAVATPMGSCHSSFSVEKDVASFTSYGATGVAEHIIPSQLVSATPSAVRMSPPSPEALARDRESAAFSPSKMAPAAETETSRQSSSFSAAPAPAAVTSGAIFKAVYRNRQQEENDPDFKRRSDVRPSYVPYVTTNPYHGAPVGYGVNPAAMGQQPPPAVPAAMMAIHVQQQAAAAHQPHFYPQTTQQFSTPQDAAAAAYALNKSVGNNPQPQWAAAPPRGYYPPQQQGQQEKHPQAWQPQHPANSSQMQLNSGLRSNSGNNLAQQFSAPANNTQNNTQPNKVLWGPGAQQGDASSPDTTVAASRTAEGAASASGGKDGAAAYKPEDFPALG